MTDKISRERRSRNMAAIRSKNTKPEVLVRRILHSEGYRFRLHVHKLPGKPDLVFKRRKKVVFVHGCFWHGCERPGCLDARRPKSNTGYWNSKLERNRARDAANIEKLQTAGWSVAVVWNCELADEQQLRDRLKDFLGPTSI